MSPLSQAHWLARAGLAFMFAYHGLVPKLLTLSAGERLLLAVHGLADYPWVSQAAGVAELLFAALLLLRPAWRWPLAVAALALLGLLLDVAWMLPALLAEAFNPVSLNLAGITLCAVAWVTQATQRAACSSA